MNKIYAQSLFFLFYKKKQCPINFDRQLGISHFKIQHGMKLCITSLSTFLSRDEHFARFFNNTPRALSVSLFSSAWLCQYFSAILLCVPLPFTAFLAPPLQLDKVNIAVRLSSPKVPAAINHPDSQS